MGLVGGWCGAEADCSGFLVEGKRAVAVLSREDGGRATIARLIGGLALDGDVRLAPARVVRLQEGAINKALGDCRENQ